MKLPEIVFHYGCIVKDGVWGVTGGVIYFRWQMGSQYDDKIAQGINYRQWTQIKMVKKLCNPDTPKKKGHGSYNLSYKFDYTWKCLIQDVHFIKMNAKLNICRDETS